MPVRIRIKPIQPEENFLTKLFGEYTTRIVSALRLRIAPMLQAEMQKWTRGWDTQVQFRGRVRIQATQIRLDVGPFGRGKQIWIYVTGGTSRHTIAPRNYPFLSIKKGYTPHTRPGGGYGGPGAYAGPYFRVYGTVDHPGYEGRQIERHIVADKLDDVVRIIARAARGIF